MVMNGDSLGDGEGWGKKSPWTENMDTAFDINELDDVVVAGGGDELVGVVPGECGEIRCARGGGR
jgi:hypothetical protein